MNESNPTLLNPLLSYLVVLTIVFFSVGQSSEIHGQQSVGEIDVYLLAGQSNMEGQGVVDLDHPQHYNSGKGILKNVMKNPKMAAQYQHIVNKQGKFVVRDDVFVRFKTQHRIKTGKLTVGYAGYEGKHHIGPEFQLGHVVGKASSNPVLLIKTAWGGKSLFKDFRPPSATGETGEYFKKMIAEYREGIQNLKREFPELKDRNPVLKGFVWFQGWNDMFDPQALREYEDNLVHLIRDVRTELSAPHLPVVIGELGNGGEKASVNMVSIRRAQLHAATKRGLINVTFVKTTDFARPKEESPNITHGHHWFGNAESYFLIGDALGQALIRLSKPK